MKEKKISLIIEDELNIINQLPLELSIKFDNELKNLYEKVENEKDIYIKTYYRTLTTYTEYEIERLDNMIFKILDLDFKNRVTNIIEELLEKKYIFIDEYTDNISTWRQIDLVGTSIIKALIKGKRLIELLENDIYLKKNIKKKDADKINSTIEVLKKALSQTNNHITSILLQKEINDLKEFKVLNKERIYKSVFYYIYMTFKTHSKKEFKIDDLTLEINYIIKEIYSLNKTPKFKSSKQTKDFKYHKLHFTYFDN